MSSSDIAISVKGLGKSYRIDHERTQLPTFRDAIVRRLKNPFGRRNLETFWALKDIDLEIQKGDVVGIIGRNGAGKSTLLKILSRITEPTTGRVDLYGRIGSLLEVGTGFHPELTGRENIFLNGSVLGMRRKEIQRQFDAIVDFAEVEKFLDMPVKHYSSGMYVRLAFAVAAHLNPEILVVDEVLAVGDAEFQKKCLGKMQEVGASGRTVLVVSHSMPTITRLCNRGILLHKGTVIGTGSIRDVAAQYMAAGGSASERQWSETDERPGDNVARLVAVRVLDEDGIVQESIDIRRPIVLELEYENLAVDPRVAAVFHLINEAGMVLFSTADFNNAEWRDTPRRLGRVVSKCRIPGNLLAEGHFSVLAAVVSYNPNVVHGLVNDAVSFVVVDRSQGDGVRGEATVEWPGVVRPMLQWEVSFVDQSRRTRPATTTAATSGN